MTKQCWLYLAFVAAAIAGPGLGCARGGGEYVPPATSEQVAMDDLAQREKQLRDLVQRRRIQEAHARGDNQQEVRRDRPYFYKEYAVYPNEGDIRIEFQETESRSAPLLASVTVPKVRYATKLHRERNAAANDSKFFRDTGHETQEYALRNGRWVSLGDTFVADTSEEQVDGAWQPVREEVRERATVQPEQDGGWFRRTWSAITGG